MKQLQLIQMSPAKSQPAFEKPKINGFPREPFEPWTKKRPALPGDLMTALHDSGKVHVMRFTGVANGVASFIWIGSRDSIDVPLKTGILRYDSSILDRAVTSKERRSISRWRLEPRALKALRRHPKSYA